MADGIRITRLNAWFGPRQVLRNIDLAVVPRSVTAIIGPSGCGKSTCVRCINRMHEVVPGARVAGRVELNGEDLYAPGADPVDVRRRIGMVFQKPNPFPTMSIFDNVAAGLRLGGVRNRAALHEAVERALHHAALWDEVKDELGKSGAGLSGGQQQRLCIARALAVEPEVLLMDEPCSALDPIATAKIDEKSVELLALHQPAAGDLRFITTIMKVVTDLERIGDQAVNIAQRALELNQEPQLKPYIDLPRMAERAQRMVKESLDAFVGRDTQLARQVCAEDAEVDSLKEQIFRELLTYMMSDPKTIPRAIRLILISRFLERVADHATNIAEMVIYMVESKMVRHSLA